MITIKNEEIKQKIIEILKDRPGLTAENLAEEIGAHRHTTSKYLLELKGAGRVQKRRIGTAVLHYLTEQIDEKTVIGEPLTEELAEEVVRSEKATEIEKEKIEEPLEKGIQPEEPKEVDSHKRIFKYAIISLSLIVLLIFVYSIRSQITGFFIFVGEDMLDKTSGLFITADDSLSKNELSIYALLKSYDGNVSKTKISNILSRNLSEYDYIVFSIDASIFMTDEICKMIADSNTPFIFSSRTFNNKCTEELHLATGSVCGPDESTIWTIVNNSYYPTLHKLTIPQKVKIFSNESYVGLCAVEGNGLYSKPIVLASRDQTHGYLVIFDDSLQRRAFFTFPNREFDLTEEGKILLRRIIIWLIGK